AAGASADALADEPVTLALPGQAQLYDILGGADLGRRERIELTLDAVEPTLLAIADAPLPAPRVAAPARLRQGESGRIEIGWTAPSPAARPVLRLEVIDPGGKPLGHYSGVLVAAGPVIERPLPLALNDPLGDWTIRV